jgi:hypothetical protein
MCFCVFTALSLRVQVFCVLTLRCRAFEVAKDCGVRLLDPEDEDSTFPQTVSNHSSHDAVLHPIKPESSCMCLYDGPFYCPVILEVLVGETVRLWCCTVLLSCDTGGSRRDREVVMLYRFTVLWYWRFSLERPWGCDALPFYCPVILVVLVGETVRLWCCTVLLSCDTGGSRWRDREVVIVQLASVVSQISYLRGLSCEWTLWWEFGCLLRYYRNNVHTHIIMDICIALLLLTVLSFALCCYTDTKTVTNPLWLPVYLAPPFTITAWLPVVIHLSVFSHL